MSNRLGFRAYLLEKTEIPNLYFQPPANTKMSYPCIRYRLSRADINHADNKPYRIAPFYELILIDKNPDSEYAQKLLGIPRIRLENTYSADNLNHWVFSIHYTGIFPEINS